MTILSLSEDWLELGLVIFIIHIVFDDIRTLGFKHIIRDNAYGLYGIGIINPDDLTCDNNPDRNP